MKNVIGIMCALCLWSATLFSQTIEAGAVQTVYFSPKDGIAERFIERIRSEQDSIKVAVYCLMHTGIAKALAEAHTRGVDVEVIIDPYSVKSRSPIWRMQEKGVFIYVWNPLPFTPPAGKKTYQRKPLMHDKFCVFGNHTVWTGSFNFTREATLANRENVVVLEGKEVAEAFLKEFDSILEERSVSLRGFHKLNDE